MIEVSLEDAGRDLPALVDAALAGKMVRIVKSPQQSVQLVPVHRSRCRQFGSASGLIVMNDNFDDELEDFTAYTL